MPDLTINGYKRHYKEVGEGPPMVFIAGTRFDAARDWVPYMRENAAGFRVVMPDPRGHLKVPRERYRLTTRLFLRWPLKM